MKTTIAIIIISIVLVILFFYWLTHRYTVVDKAKSNNYYYNFFKTEIHYVPMGNWFALGDSPIPDLDLQNFSILSSHHIKDNKAVYFESIKLFKVDLATFEVVKTEGLHAKFSKDKNNLYYCTNTFENIDLNSFKIDFSNKTITDKNNTYSWKYASEWDSFSIKPLPKNFATLGIHYGRDTNDVLYYHEKEIPHSSAKKFQSLNSFKDELVATESGIYNGEYKLSNIDVSTFSIIEDSYCFKDKNGIYCGTEFIVDKFGGRSIITGYKALKLDVDMETFQSINGIYSETEKFETFYAIDKNGVYYIYPFLKIENVDKATFEIIKDKSGRFAKDKNHTYLDGKIYTDKTN